METDVCFFGKSSATHPSHTKTADVGFWLFPRAKVVRMFFKSKEKMMLRILVGCYGVLRVVLRIFSVTDSRRIA